MTLEQLRAIVHAAMIWLTCYALVPSAEMQKVSEQRHFGTVVYLALVLSVNIRAVFITRTWTWINHFGFIITCAAAVVVLPIYTIWMDLDYAWFHVFWHILQTPVFYLAMIAVPAVLSLFDMACSMIDSYTKCKCLQPVDVDAIIAVDPHPQHDWHAPSLGRHRSGHHADFHPHLHASNDSDAELAERQHQAQITHHKSEKQIEAEERRRRSPIWQQDLHASTWIPKEHFVRCFGMLGLVLLILGVLTVVTSNDVEVLQVQYGGDSGAFSELPTLSLFPEHYAFRYLGNVDVDSNGASCQPVSAPLAHHYGAGATMCQFNITVSRDMPAPVHVMFRLNRFWQNYQLYIDDFDEAEMRGDHYIDDNDQVPDCRYFTFEGVDDPAVLDATDSNGVHTFNGTALVPCGLIANTMFTDELRLIGVDGETDSAAVPVLNESDLVWPSDYVKISQPPLKPDNRSYWQTYPNSKNISLLYERYSHIIDRDEGVHDPHFLAWTRTEMLSDFRKPYGVIHRDIDAGTKLTLQIVSSFDVAAYGGAKAFVLTS